VGCGLAVGGQTCTGTVSHTAAVSAQPVHWRAVVRCSSAAAVLLQQQRPSASALWRGVGGPTDQQIALRLALRLGLFSPLPATATMTITSSRPSNTKTLPSPTYAIQVHRQHAVRVRDELEQQSISETDWTTLTQEAVQKDDGESALSSSSSTLSSTWNHGIGDIEYLPPTEKTTCILSPKESGPRQSRTGYNMIVTRNAACSPGDLPALARQHISWAGRLTNQTNVMEDQRNSSKHTSGIRPGECEKTVGNLCASVATLAFKQLTGFGFGFAETDDSRADELRLDVRPKSFALPLCQELQRLAVEAEIPLRADTDPNDPYDGPMRMTRSIVKSACVLSAVFDSLIENGSDLTSRPTCCYWGITPTSEHAGMINKLNNFAKEEVQIAKPDDTTCDGETPTSRAFYKLQQVFDKYFTQSIFSAKVDGTAGAGLDLGASPGGWTQVLFRNGLRPVVSVDPGLLAPRVQQLEGVHHIKGDFNGDDAVRGIADNAPYTAIVCDANISHGCDKKIMEMIDKVVSELEKEGDEVPLLTLPAVAVLTLKFAYKTEKSMKKNYASAKKMIPGLLMSIVDAQCRASTSSRDHIACRYTFVHLHANSDSERTVLAIFEETDEGRKRKRGTEEEPKNN